MKKILKYMACALLFGVCLTGCKEEEGVIPSDITNLRAESTPGRIVLRWDTPEDGNIRYVQVNYYDPLLKKDVMKTASVYADSVEIPDTRKKYGEYSFQVKTVSNTGDEGNIQSITATSEAALSSFVSNMIVLKAGDMSTNAQESSEGPIANLVDGDNSTFFHSSWSVDVPAPHWFQANLNTELSDHYKFIVVARNGSNRPSNVDLMGSTDGTNWFLIRNFTKEADGLSASSPYNSQVFAIDKPFSQIRFVVNETNTGTVFFSMGEFKFYNVSMIDPEAPDEE